MKKQGWGRSTKEAGREGEKGGKTQEKEIGRASCRERV